MRTISLVAKFIVGALVSQSSFASNAEQRPVADDIFINGKVFTADASSSVAQAFAVKDGRFIGVGTTRAVKQLANKRTRVHDLNGRFVTPGLGDAHFHGEGGGHGIDLSTARSIADLLSTIREAVARKQPGEVIVSNNDWHEAQLREQRLPTATELDVVAPNNPIVLVRGGHDYILNSMALRKWQIGKETTAPAGGAIAKNEQGDLTGELIDSAKRLVQLPPPAPLAPQDLLDTQRAVNAFGITNLRIPGSYKGDLFETYRLMKELRDSHSLTVRYNVYLPGIGSSADSLRAMIEQSGIKPGEGDAWVRIGGIKMGVDGGFEGGHMSQPYVGSYGKGGTFYGLTTTPPDKFTAAVKEANRLGWRVTTHAVGDAAVDEVLDAYEEANAERPIVGEHWAIEHLFVTRRDQLERMKKLGLILSVQDHLYLAAPVLKNYLGKDRASQITPLKTYLDYGFLVAGGTDSPVVPFNPFWELYHFMTRDTISDGVYGENQVVTSRSDLLRLITINYAKLTDEDALKGSIEPGKLADFAVLSGDFLAMPEPEITKLKALVTYVGGQQVYLDQTYSDSIPSRR